MPRKNTGRFTTHTFAVARKEKSLLFDLFKAYDQIGIFFSEMPIFPHACDSKLYLNYIQIVIEKKLLPLFCVAGFGSDQTEQIRVQILEKGDLDPHMKL